MSLDIIFKISPVIVPGHQAPSPDLRVSTIEDHRRLLHVSVVQPDHVAISYVGAREPDASSIQLRHVQEFSSEVRIPANSWLYRNTLRISDRRFNYQTKDALITHLVKTVDSRAFPLWYKHEFKWEVSNLRSVRITNSDGTELSSDRYMTLLREGSVIIAHDVESGVSEEAGSGSYHLVEYNDVDGFRRVELLKNSSLYSRATVFQQNLAQSYTYASEYIEGVPDSFSFRIFLSRDENGAPFSGPWYVRPLAQHQIQVVQPDVVVPSSRWSVRVTDGDVIGFVDGEPIRYSIPEYHLQSFLPNEPFKYTRGSEATVVGSKLVKLPYLDMVDDNPSTPIDIIVLNERFEVRAGFTTGQSGRNWEGRLDQWVPAHSSIAQELVNLYESSGSVSSERGLLHLPIELNSSDRVFILGHYKEKSYELTALNLNPVLNPSMRTGKAIVYVLSSSGLAAYPDGEVGRGVHYIIVDSLNNILEWSHYSISDPNNPEAINPLYTGLNISQYDKFIIENTDILILAEIAIDRSQAPDDLSYIDVRHKHGRIRKTIEDQIEILAQETPELLWLSENSLSEKSVPFCNALSAIVPKEKFEDFNFLEDYTTSFLSQNITEALSLHAGAGQAIIWEPDLSAISRNSSVVSFFREKCRLVTNGAVDLSGLQVELHYTISDDLKLKFDGNGAVNPDGTAVHSYSLAVRLSGVAPKVDSQGIAESSYTELELPATTSIETSLTVAGNTAIAVPEELIATLVKDLYVHITLKQDGKDVARTEILKMRLKKTDTLSYSDSVNFSLEASIEPAPSVSFTLEAEVS
jgi:hypothetical protein